MIFRPFLNDFSRCVARQHVNALRRVEIQANNFLRVVSNRIGSVQLRGAPPRKIAPGSTTRLSVVSPGRIRPSLTEANISVKNFVKMLVTLSGLSFDFGKSPRTRLPVTTVPPCSTRTWQTGAPQKRAAFVRCGKLRMPTGHRMQVAGDSVSLRAPVVRKEFREQSRQEHR